MIFPFPPAWGRQDKRRRKNKHSRFAEGSSATLTDWKLTWPFPHSYTRYHSLTYTTRLINWLFVPKSLSSLKRAKRERKSKEDAGK